MFFFLDRREHNNEIQRDKILDNSTSKKGTQLTERDPDKAFLATQWATRLKSLGTKHQLISIELAKENLVIS